MAMLQVRDMDDRLYDKLRLAAKLDNRSISQQVVTILQSYFTSVPVGPKNATEEFLEHGITFMGLFRLLLDEKALHP